LPAFGKVSVYVTQYIRNLRGGSQSILAQASDGQLDVVKFTNNLQSANLLFNESMGTELFQACGLAVPSWRPLLLTDAFIDRNPGCWMQTEEGRLRPEPGLCFGSHFLGGEGIRLLEILPETSYKRVRNRESFWLAWMIDICARQADSRQAIFLEDAQGWQDAYFVDHGHLFGGPKGEQKPRFLASRYLDPRIYQSVSSDCLLSFRAIAAALDVDRFWHRVQTLPQSWKMASALNGLAECLGRLSNANLLRNVLDTMVDAHQRREEFERNGHQDGRKPPAEVLCLGVPATGVEQRPIPGCVPSRACA
jgi:hypothetical protein